MPATFAEIIAPMTPERFLAEHWNKTMLHQPGAKGRFAPLLGWDDLSAILETHPPPHPQVRLFQDNQMVDARRYVEGVAGELRFNAGGLVAALSQGASLVMDSVQDVAPRVGALAEVLKDALDGQVQANVYAGWRPQRAFDLHWDSQDVFVLQLSGRKHWTVHAPTRPHPLREDMEEAPKPAPGQAPIFDGILNDGDLLYLPRGFWHTAIALDEPSLHVTFGVVPANGMEFLQWWLPQLLRHAEVRANLPLQADAASRQAWLARLLHLMQTDGADPVGSFLAQRAAGRPARPRLRLPMAPLEQAQALTMATRLRLATHHALLIEIDAGGRTAQLAAGGKRWNFRPELVPVLRRLSSNESVTLQDLCAGLPQDLVATLMHALETLAGLGLVFKESGA